MELEALEKANEILSNGQPVRLAKLTKEEKDKLKGLMLLTMKPVIYAANVADVDLAEGNEMSRQVFEFAAKDQAKSVLVSAQVSVNKLL